MQDAHAIIKDYLPTVTKEHLLELIMLNRKPDAPKKLGPQELNKYIRALTNEEHELMFDMAEADNNDKGHIEKDF